jgi:N-methylhydantoinase A
MPVVLLNYGITAVGRHHKPAFTRAAVAASPDPSHALQGNREVFSIERDSRIPLPVYDDKLLRPGNVIEGPAIVNAHDTTISVPEGVLARRDELMNYHLTEAGADA